MLIFAVNGFIASAQTLQTLVSFNGTNGALPFAALTLGNDGNFFGTTYGGGSSNCGTVFQITSNGTLTSLVSFNGTNGKHPDAALTLGNDGNFYGTTSYGGNTNFNSGSGFGTVFKVTTNGTLTTLVSFNDTNGEFPVAALTLGNDGNFYGTTLYNFYPLTTDSNIYGTVFQVTTNGTLTTLISFNATNGEDPSAALTLGNDGNFYGTASAGGDYSDGTIFQITTDGTLTTLFSFNGINGSSPNGLTPGNDGNFYGTTQFGGSSDNGTIFKITTNGTMISLVSFNGTNGLSPEAGLTLGNDGNFYGTTEGGGDTNLNGGYGYGTIFCVTTNGRLTTLVTFNGTNGSLPDAGLTLGNDGNFYGTARAGGDYGDGTIFRLSFSPVVPPTLTLQFLTGYPLLSLYGTMGDTYTIQYTTNLATPDWTPMLIVTNLLISPFQMIDPAGVGQQSRFYRAVQSQ